MMRQDYTIDELFEILKKDDSWESDSDEREIIAEMIRFYLTML